MSTTLAYSSYYFHFAFGRWSWSNNRVCYPHHPTSSNVYSTQTSCWIIFKLDAVFFKLLWLWRKWSYSVLTACVWRWNYLQWFVLLYLISRREIICMAFDLWLDYLVSRWHYVSTMQTSSRLSPGHIDAEWLMSSYMMLLLVATRERF